MGIMNIRVLYRLLSGRITEAEIAADELLAKGVGAVIITLGDKGALYRDRSRSVHVPVISAGPVVETTGAGDAFNAGYLGARLNGQSPSEAARAGHATAGWTIMRPGAIPAQDS